jgi:hypothetical protein
MQAMYQERLRCLELSKLSQASRRRWLAWRFRGCRPHSVNHLDSPIWTRLQPQGEKTVENESSSSKPDVPSHVITRLIDGDIHTVGQDTVMTSFLDKLAESAKREKGYFHMSLFILFAFIFCAMTNLQRSAPTTYGTRQALMGSALSDLQSTFYATKDILRWVEQSVIPKVYTDATCGDGTCSSPVEIQCIHVYTFHVRA